MQSTQIGREWTAVDADPTVSDAARGLQSSLDRRVTQPINEDRLT
jgi:hypothetical protein